MRSISARSKPQAKHAQPVVVGAVSDDRFLFRDDVNEAVAHPLASFEDRLHAQTGDEEGVWVTAAHPQFPLTLVNKHLEHLAHHGGLAGTGKAGDANLRMKAHDEAPSRSEYGEMGGF